MRREGEVKCSHKRKHVPDRPQDKLDNSRRRVRDRERESAKKFYTTRRVKVGRNDVGKSDSILPEGSRESF